MVEVWDLMWGRLDIWCFLVLLLRCRRRRRRRRKGSSAVKSLWHKRFGERGGIADDGVAVGSDTLFFQHSLAGQIRRFPLSGLRNCVWILAFSLLGTAFATEERYSGGNRGRPQRECCE